MHTTEQTTQQLLLLLCVHIGIWWTTLSIVLHMTNWSSGHFVSTELNGININWPNQFLWHERKLNSNMVSCRHTYLIESRYQTFKLYPRLLPPGVPHLSNIPLVIPSQMLVVEACLQFIFLHWSTIHVVIFCFYRFCHTSINQPTHQHTNICSESKMCKMYNMLCLQALNVTQPLLMPCICT